MSDIFISYRRLETDMAAGRLYAQLKAQFGEGSVFIDTGGIPPGVDFIDELAVRLSSCRIFLAVIGPHWARVRTGLSRRIGLPGDFVRLEVFAASNRRITLIPILVSGAQMPTAKDLPNSIGRLCDIQAVRVSTDNFAQDVNAIVPQIRDALATWTSLTDEEFKKERIRIRDLLLVNLDQEKKTLTRRSVLTAAGISIPSVGLVYVGFHKPPNTNQPLFAQPTQGATSFKIPHSSDADAYEIIDRMNRDRTIKPLKFRPSRGGTEPILRLSDVFGSQGKQVWAAIENKQEICFHSVGCTGSTRGPSDMALVADRLADEINGKITNILPVKPTFMFHLGDIIYSFGEEAYYYDQFYFPHRNYLGPIVGIPGNHDGLVRPGDPESSTLASFFKRFCADEFVPALPAALDVIRTPQIQPGAYFIFEAPFVRIIGLYSNNLEDPGVIADDSIGFDQLNFLEEALGRIRSERYKGAIIFAHHHPVYTSGSVNGLSLGMRNQIDTLRKKLGIWPHAVLSAHAHNYQRFTRKIDGKEIPYVVAGAGGHGLARLRRAGVDLSGGLPWRLELESDDVVLEQYDDHSYGFLRLNVTGDSVKIRYIGAEKGDERDGVTIDVNSRMIVS